MKNAKKAFEDSIVHLCKILSPEKIQRLDFILTQEKEEAEIVTDIVREFPNFKYIYAAKLAE